MEEDFQQKLKEKAVDYIDFAKRYRPPKAKGGTAVNPAVVVSANEEVAEELSEDEMAEQLEVVEIMPVPDEPDPAVIAAKAARLRAQKIEPRIVEVGGRIFRIYHPQEMPVNDPYYFRQSAEDNVIDIFINDNHPFVEAKAVDESSYLMFVRMCVMDAIVEHSLLHHDRKELLRRSLPQGSALARHQGLSLRRRSAQRRLVLGDGSGYTTLLCGASLFVPVRLTPRQARRAW